MAVRLTENEKKQIQIDYAEIGSYLAVAKKYGISDKRVKRIVEQDKEFQEKIKKKQEENAKDILGYMDTKKDVVCNIIGKYLIALQDDEKIAKAAPHQLTTALGTLIDKFTMNDKPKEEVHPFIKELLERTKKE